jgi:GMP synthase (glutamine-hydrolysing) A subunit
VSAERAPAALRPPDIHADRVLILDFGAQYTQLIARRIRESGVYCEIHPWDMSDADVRAFNPRGIVLSGGPESVTDVEPPRAPAAVFELGVPVLGICYGMQTMAQQLGGRVTPASHREFGYAQVTVTAPCRLFDGLRDHADAQGRPMLDVWMSHGDRVDSLPQGFLPVASTANAPFAAMADEARRYFAVQFHPEVTHTLQGAQIIERFVREICGCDARWEPGNIIADAVARVREQVGDDRVLLGLPAVSIRRSSRRCCIARSASSSSACSSTTGCCAQARATKSCRRSRRTWASTSCASMPSRVFSTRCAARPIPNASARSSGGCSSRCSRNRRTSSKAFAGSRRARSIPT